MLMLETKRRYLPDHRDQSEESQFQKTNEIVQRKTYPFTQCRLRLDIIICLLEQNACIAQPHERLRTRLQSPVLMRRQ